MVILRRKNKFGRHILRDIKRSIAIVIKTAWYHWHKTGQINGAKQSPDRELNVYKHMIYDKRNIVKQ